MTGMPWAAAINAWTPCTPAEIDMPGDVASRSLTPMSSSTKSGWYVPILFMKRVRVIGSEALAPRHPALMTTTPDVAGAGGSGLQSLESLLRMNVNASTREAPWAAYRRASKVVVTGNGATAHATAGGGMMMVFDGPVGLLHLTLSNDKTVSPIVAARWGRA
jgi:hypothetical protein